MIRLKAFLLFVIFVSTPTFSQWSSDPSVNLAISDSTHLQSISNIISRSDGGSYVAWFKYEDFNYNVYMQRLDPSGTKLWGESGLLISQHQSTIFFLRPAMLVDREENVILAFHDYRILEKINTYAYKISPSGDFLWGADGINIYETFDWHSNQRITQVTDGNLIISFNMGGSQGVVVLQKLSSDGIKLWGGQPVIISSPTEHYFRHEIVPSDNNSVIVIHTSWDLDTLKIRAVKVNEDGSMGWSTIIQNPGGVLVQYPNKICVSPDSLNGAIISWSDDRNSVGLYNVYIQRISSSGTIYFPENGIIASLKPSRKKIQPVISYDYLNDEIYVNWIETDSSQTKYGISGQKLEVNGNRLWGDDGKNFKDLSEPGTTKIKDLLCQFGSEQNYLFYLVGDYSPEENHLLEGFATNSNGEFLWPGDFVTLSNPTLEKWGLASTIDHYSNCKLTWVDKRNSEWGIYAQDINPYGELGNPVVPVELISFTGFYNVGTITLNWTTATELNNFGFEIERRSKEGQFITIGYVEGNGTTTEPQEYSYKDKNAGTGIYYYRLKQIDFGGQYEYSDEIKVKVNGPLTFTLEQNYPNPFNPSTTIKYVVSSSQFVSLKVYDVLGDEIAILVNEEKPSGNYEVEYNASSLPSGVYFYQLKSGSFVETKKMLLLK